MGQEIQCRMEFNGKWHSGRALLETKEIIFRGDLRLKIPWSRIREVRAETGQLHVAFDESVAVFELGKAADKWADKILNPPTRIAKFGIKPGTTFRCIGPVDGDFLAEMRVGGAVEAADSEVVLMAASGQEALEELRSLPDKAVWIIYPKGVKTITEGDVLKAGREAGLVDIKVVGFSDTHTALKFVPRKK